MWKETLFAYVPLYIQLNALKDLRIYDSKT